MRLHYPLNTNGAEDAGQLPWKDGVPSTGVQGSYPGHAIVTDTEAEILAAIDAAGLTRSSTDLSQLVQAMSRGIYLGGFTGSANTLVATLPNNLVLPTLLPGMRFRGIASITNTDAVTVTLNGFATAPGTLSLLRRDGSVPQAGDVQIGVPFDFQFDGSAMRFTAPTKSEIAAPATTIISNLSIVGQRLLASWAAAGAYLWTCPDNVTKALIEGQAAGAGGGAGNGYAGAGGTGGNWFRGVFDVVPRTVYQAVIGAGGAPGAGGNPGGNGGLTSFGPQGGTVFRAVGGGAGGGSGGGAAPGPQYVGIANLPSPVGTAPFPYGGVERQGYSAQNGIGQTTSPITYVGGQGGGSPLASSTTQPYSIGAFNGTGSGGGGSGGAGTTNGGQGADGYLSITG